MKFSILHNGCGFPSPTAWPGMIRVASEGDDWRIWDAIAVGDLVSKKRLYFVGNRKISVVGLGGSAAAPRLPREYQTTAQGAIGVRQFQSSGRVSICFLS